MKTQTASVKLKQIIGIGERPAFLWVIQSCPICGRKHIHGAGTDRAKVRQTLGSRVPHCKPGIDKRDYMLKWNGETI